MKSDNPRWFRVPRNVTACYERLDLRRKPECPTVVGCIERLDAIRIASQKKATSFTVPYNECEHATEPMYHLRAMSRVQMQQDLRIGGGSEVDTVGFKFNPQLRIVVDFTIEDDHQTFIVTRHGLSSPIGKIDDREASVTQATSPVHTPPCTRPIGASSAHGLARLQEFSLLWRTRCKVVRENAVYATHVKMLGLLRLRSKDKLRARDGAAVRE